MLERLEVEPTQVLSENRDAPISQTAYCYTRIPKSIVFAGNISWLEMSMDSELVTCIFTTTSAVNAFKGAITKTTLVSDHSAEWFHLLHNVALQNDCFETNQNVYFVSASATVDSTAILRGPVFIDDNVSIGPHSVITGPVYIGPGSRIVELVTIGSRGLFAKKIGGTLTPFNYYGGVTIGTNSHIHARANVAASPHFLNFTLIGNNVSLGISANIGHDCVINDDSTVASTACICGRGVVGKNAWIGAGAIVSDASIVHENARVRIGSVVVEDVAAGADVSGNFAICHKRNLREYVKRK